MEFLADLIREILNEDEDGIVPLVRNAGEEILIDRIEKKFEEKGLSSAQFSAFPTILGKEINEYINKNFFADFSNHLNLFMYLPKTPFIWHITSGHSTGLRCLHHHLQVEPRQAVYAQVGLHRKTRIRIAQPSVRPPE